MNKEELIKTLQSNYDDEAPIEVNDEEWTLADLFAIQHLDDYGFFTNSMTNVEKMYALLCENKELLLDNNMISEMGVCWAGHTLWNNFDFDEIEMIE